MSCDLVYCGKMYKCFVCGKTVTFSKLIMHLKFFHPETTYQERFKCSSCYQNFNKVNSYVRHLKLHQQPLNDQANIIPEDIINEDNHCVPLSNNFKVIDNNSGKAELTSVQSVNLCQTVDKPDSDNESLMFESSIKQHYKDFISNLYSISSLNRKNVQDIVNETNKLQFGVINTLKKSVFTTIKENTPVSQPLCQKVDKKFDVALFHQSQLTEHRRITDLKSLRLYIEPVQYFFDQSLQNKRKLNSNYLEPVILSAHYIPITKTLSSIFSLPGVLELSKNYMATSDNVKDSYTDFIDGDLWKRKRALFPNKIVFPLFIYYDDIEVGNVLGSHSGVHKLGAVYFVLKCLPPKYLSKLENINLSMLFHSSDRVQYGNEKTFKPLIDDLIRLEERGLEIDVDGKTEHIYFVLALLLGDNLGSNSWGGFVESFSANFCCRHCLVPKNELRELCEEKVYYRRTIEQYDEHCNMLRPDLTGIKEPCVFNRIQSFHIIENAHVDILHDLAEGSFNFNVALILNRFIYAEEYKYFTLDMLNFRILNFNYGFLQNSNKPPIIIKENLNSGKLKMSAGEMMTFIKVLRFLIGEFVPLECKEWHLYILVLKIYDIVFSKHIPKGCVNLLRILISEHHELYMELFGHLRPKFHFMTHYGSVITESGPVAHFNSFRFESKHTEIKIIATNMKNRKNLTKSITVRYQLKQCKRLSKKFDFLDDIKFSKIFSLSAFKSCYKHKILSLIDEESVNCTNSFKVDGSTYQIGSKIIVTSSDMFPVFGEIIAIILKEKVSLIIQLFCTISQCSHYNAFEVMLTHKFICKEFNANVLEIVDLYACNKKKYIVCNNL